MTIIIFWEIEFIKELYHINSLLKELNAKILHLKFNFFELNFNKFSFNSSKYPKLFIHVRRYDKILFFYFRQ